MLKRICSTPFQLWNFSINFFKEERKPGVYFEQTEIKNLDKELSLTQSKISIRTKIQGRELKYYHLNKFRVLNKFILCVHQKKSRK